MIDAHTWQQLMASFATLLDYPGSDLTAAARRCEEMSARLPGVDVNRNATVDEDRGATARLRAFRLFMEETLPGRLEEIYSDTFDLNATCHPYVGYHLLGESYKRSSFMLALREHYRDHDFEPPQTELPDHLAVIVRFLSVLSPASHSDLIEEIVREALLPTLDRMTGQGESLGYDDETPQALHPYQDVLEALRLVLSTVASEQRPVGSKPS